MELLHAHYQWATRPADQRFPSLQALHEATKAYAARAREKTIRVASLRAEAQHSDQKFDAKGEVVLVGRGGQPAYLTHWAFGQLCDRVNAPANYLRTLPATLACQNINHGLRLRNEREGADATVQILFQMNDVLLTRAFMTDAYERIWNYELTERLMFIQQYGWEPARPDFNKTGADFPALYASDHDMFAFVRLPNVTIQQPVAAVRGTAPLYRGAIYENSEVGAKRIRVLKFWYNGMCGNHIIWGASDVTEFAARHVGKVRDKLHRFDVFMRRYAEEGAADDEKTFAKATQKRIATNKEDLLNRLFGIRTLGLSRKQLRDGHNAIVPEQDGDPLTVWGMVQGLTRYSQTIPYADERVQFERNAGKLFNMVDKF